MAYPTVDAPYGLTPVKLLSGVPYVGTTRQYGIASGYATSIFYGDAVKLVAGGTVERDTFDAAMQAVRGQCEIAALTRSEKGAVIVAGDDVHVVDAEPLDKIIDTTGAGDLYAAGFLTGLTAGRCLPQCGRMASISAAEVISHMGARPEADLKALMKEKLS